MNEEIVKEIEESAKSNEELELTEEHEKITWLIFDICDKKYAIKSNEVNEIIRDMTIYKLPFLPAYIEGVINRRGDPYAVLNPLAVVDPDSDKSPEQPLFLVLKRDDDQISLHISDILFFHDTEIGDMHLIPNNDEYSVFLGTIEFNHEDVPVLNPNAFEFLLRKDLGSLNK